MYIRAAVAVLIWVTASVGAATELSIAISRRIPAAGETVRLSAHIADWEAPRRRLDVVFTAMIGGRQQVLGKCLAATDPGRPFSPSVQWQPETAGLYRVFAGTQGGGLQGKLLVPVVLRPLYFCFDGYVEEHPEWMTHAIGAPDEQIDALHARGAIALKQCEGIQPGCDILDAPEDLASALADRCLPVAPWDGIILDGLSVGALGAGRTDLLKAVAEALGEVRARSAEQFVAAWHSGKMHETDALVCRAATDLVIKRGEGDGLPGAFGGRNAYQNLRRTVDATVESGLQGRLIPAFDLGAGEQPEAAGIIEDRIRYIRLHAPRTPGAAFVNCDNCREQLLEAAGDCCYRYWIKPAVTMFSAADITMSDYQPQRGGTVDVCVAVHNIGGMAARDVIVRLWDGNPAAQAEAIGEAHTIRRIPSATPSGHSSGGTAIVTFEWTPLEAGPHELCAQIVPSTGYTTIQALQSETVLVR